MISLREIMKNESSSKENSAAEGGKNLFTQPRTSLVKRYNYPAIILVGKSYQPAHPKFAFHAFYGQFEPIFISKRKVCQK